MCCFVLSPYFLLAVMVDYQDDNRDEEYMFHRLQPLIVDSTAAGKYDKHIMFMILVNYMIGVGYLAVPYAFDRAGILLSTFITIIAAFMMYMTSLWVAESSHRGMQLIEESERTSNFASSLRVVTSLSSLKPRRKSKSTTPRSHSASSTMLSSTLTSTPTPTSDSEALTSSTTSTTPFEYASINEILPDFSHSPSTFKTPEELAGGRARKNSFEQNLDLSDGLEPEVVDLVFEFLGTPGKTLYQVSLNSMTYVGLLVYAQVFMETTNALLHVPILISATLFGGTVLYLSFQEVHQQVDLQVYIFLARCVVIFIYITGMILAILIDPYDNDNIDIIVVDSASNSGITFPYPYISEDIPMAYYSGFGAMFSTALFSLLFHQAVPGLIRPLSQEDKAEVPQIFGKAIITSASVCILLGVLGASYFGNLLQTSISLNFVGMSWGLGHDPSRFAQYKVWLVLVDIISFVIALFPALDAIFTFSLIASTLGNNLQISFPNSGKFVENNSSFFGEVTSKDNLYTKTTALWRCTAVIPPIFMSVFITDMSLSVQLAGICGIIVSMVIPALLQRYSRARLQVDIKTMSSSFLLAENPYSTQYTTETNGNLYTNTILIFAIIVLSVSANQVFILI